MKHTIAFVVKASGDTSHKDWPNKMQPLMKFGPFTDRARAEHCVVEVSRRACVSHVWIEEVEE